MPQLFPPVEFSVYVEKEKKEPSKIFMGGLTDNVVPLKKALGHIHVKDTLDFLIGPEGDFSEKEYIQAKENSWHVVSLGSQVLRVDTAVISAISFIRQFYLD